MEINLPTLIIIVIGAIAVITFLIKKNQEDKKDVEKEIKYFRKPDESEINDKDDGL